MINTINILCLLLLAATVPLPPSKDDKLIITIQISMDDIKGSKSYHESYKYFIYDSGFTTNYGEITDGSIESGSIFSKQLSQTEMEKVKQIVKNLPVLKEDVPKERSLILTEIQSDGKKEKIYDKTKIPAIMKDLFTIIGRARGEIKFEPEQKDRPNR